MRTLLLLILFAIPSLSPVNRVQDNAGILSNTEITQLQQLSAQVDTETSAELAVITLDSLEGETIEGRAYQVFNQLGIGKKGVNNGVLLLVAPNERRMRIEVGYGLEPLLTDSLCGEIRDKEILPFFRAGNMNQGILQGTQRIAQILRDYPEAARGVPGSAPKFVRTPYRTGIGFLIAAAVSVVLLFICSIVVGWRRQFPTWLLAVGALGIVGICTAGYFFITNNTQTKDLIPFSWGAIGVSFLSLIHWVRKFMRFGVHKCSKCKTNLVLMDEAKDDEKLTEIQRLEESLGAVDYDVWVCPACLQTDVEKYVGSFSKYSQCPQCKNHTCDTTSTVSVTATYLSTGLRRIDRNCLACKFHDSRTEIIPRRQRSTSSSSSGGFSSSGGSSGGGFGGGSSGGGGASGSW